MKKTDRNQSPAPNPLRAAAVTLVCGAAACLSGPAGCGTSAKEPVVFAEPPPPAYLPPVEHNASRRPVSEAISTISAGGRSAGEGPVLVAQQRLAAQAGGPEGVGQALIEPGQQGELIPVEFNTNTADISDVMRALLREFLNRDYVLDPRLSGQMTLSIEGEFTRTDLMDLVSGLVALQGWYMEEREGVLFIRPGDGMAKSADAPVLQAAPALASDQPAVRVRRLRHIAPDQVSMMLRELISPNAKALVVGRTIILADTTRQIARLSRLMSALDAPAFDGVEIWTYRLQHRRPEDAQKIMESLSTASQINAGADAQVAFVPVPGTQRLMVVARDGTLQPMVRELLREVDQPSESERRHRYTYRVQHYAQQALVRLLSEFFAEKIESQPGQPAAASQQGDAGQRIRIVSDAQSDLLLIYATPSDYSDLLATLRVIDRAPQQVVIQSIIAEVRLTKNLEFGVEYFLSTLIPSQGSLDVSAINPISNPALATGSAFFIGGSGFALIQALDRESSARVLSQPKLVIADRAKGSIQVGGEVPTIRATQGAPTQQAGSSDIRTEIEYRDTGVILDIEPAINESGLITLKIRQEVADALPTQVANQPEFTKRTIETTVVVPSGKTVLLGGIINHDDRRNNNRVPFLGRVPVAGELFGNRQNTTQRTELLLALTPTVVNEPDELVGLTGEFIRSVAGVRAALYEAAMDLPRGALHSLDAPLPLEPGPEAGSDEAAPADPPTEPGA